jgi:hypothetical protein
MTKQEKSVVITVVTLTISVLTGLSIGTWVPAPTIVKLSIALVAGYGIGKLGERAIESL